MSAGLAVGLLNPSVSWSETVYINGGGTGNASASGSDFAVLCGGFAEADLSATGCIAIYRDPADLLARYEESLLARDQPPPPEVPILLT